LKSTKLKWLNCKSACAKEGGHSGGVMYINRKKSNEWYREEIDDRTRDTVMSLKFSVCVTSCIVNSFVQKEFINYLENKKAEKQTIIEELNEVNRKDYGKYLSQKEAIEKEYDQRINGTNFRVLYGQSFNWVIPELQNVILDLDVKLESKQQEILQLSDVVVSWCSKVNSKRHSQ
jgi:hypothetical protein